MTVELQSNQNDRPLLETELVLFRQSVIHGTGGFAKQDIAKGTHVLEYVGEIIDKQESLCRCEQDNQYVFTLDSEHDIDGNVEWNPARFLNHSCAPNCEAVIENGRIWIVAIADIKAGQEITFNYGYDLVDYKQFPCRCGAPNCVGYIVAEEFFDHVRRQAELSSPPGQS